MKFEPQLIDVILHSFKRYGLGDIELAQPHPVGAFILCLCFIDQVASFRYSSKLSSNVRANKLVKNYMPAYDKLRIDIYPMLRNSLIHHYSTTKEFDIDNRGYETVAFHDTGKVIHINTNVFITHLRNAFNDLENDFKIVGSEAYNNAIKRSKRHPVLVDTRP